MHPDASFGQWLKQQRRACDLTQIELARRVYCAEITIRKIEADQLRPSRELAVRIVSVLETADDERTLLRLARRRTESISVSISENA